MAPPDDANSGDTMIVQPMGKKPDTGLQAWLATLGYISAEHSPDAALTLRAYPQEEAAVRWSAACTWAQNQEMVDDQPSLALALRALWVQIERIYTLFKSVEAAVKRPSGYRDDKWVDPMTQQMLDRLIGASQLAFKTDWRLILVYQPVATPTMRVQARLMARGNQVRSGGRGASIPEACRALYRHAAPEYFANLGPSLDAFFSET